MLAVFIAIFLIMAVMIYFITASLRIVTENANKKVNAYFLSKLGEYDKDFKEKMNKLEELRESREEVEQEIKILKLDYNALNVSRFYKPRPVINDTYIPVAHYIDNEFFSDYKKAKRLLVMDKAQIIRTVLEKYPYEGNIKRYNSANSIKKKLNYEAMYDLCTLPKMEQLRVLSDALEKSEVDLLEEYIKTLLDPTTFDVIGFIDWIRFVVNEESPMLTAYLGEEDEDYSDVADNVQCLYDKNVCEGIRIIYQGRLFDYSIYESRKKNERVY